MSNLSVGDFVKIDKASFYYNLNSLGNPQDTVGMVICSNSGILVDVLWMNGFTNCYSDFDLCKENVTESEQQIFRMLNGV